MAPTQVPTTNWGGGVSQDVGRDVGRDPHVAATAGLVFARARALGIRLSADEAIQIVRMTADDLKSAARGYEPGWDPLSGWGRVNTPSPP